MDRRVRCVVYHTSIPTDEERRGEHVVVGFDERERSDTVVSSSVSFRHCYIEFLSSIVCYIEVLQRIFVRTSCSGIAETNRSRHVL